MKNLLSSVCLVAWATAAHAELHKETIEYKQRDTTLEGFLAYDTAVTGRRPGVLVVHQWKGLSGYEKKRAEMLAKLGYNVFCVDIYGKGIRPDNPKDAAAEAGKYKPNRTLLRTRDNAGLDTANNQ